MRTQNTRRELLGLVGGGIVSLAGCVGTTDDTDTGSSETPAKSTATASSSSDSGETDSESADNTNRPVWQTTTLTDVTTGESFTIGQFDRPVIVHTFATWCPTCRGQQQEIKRYLREAGDSVVAVDLTIDENDGPKKLRTHAKSNGFDWRFAVSPSSVTKSLVDQFGRKVASAPQSPVIIVCPGGSTHTVRKGAPATEIRSAIENSCA